MHLKMDEQSIHNQSYSYTFPSYTLLIPPIILTLQSSLLFLSPSSSIPHSPLIRFSLLPFALYAIWSSCSSVENAFFHPVKDFIHFNTVIQLSKFWACMRAVEFAIADPGEYTWTGYEKAYRAGKEVTQESKQGNGDGDRKNHQAGNLSTHKKGDNEKAEDEDPSIRTMATRNPLLSGWLNLCSLRGIGYQWGIKGCQVPSPHPSSRLVPSLLFRIIWSHILTTLAVSFVVYHRQHSSSHHEVLSTYFPNLPKDSMLIRLASRFLQVGAFGCVVYTTLECGYSLLTLTVYLLTSLLRIIVPSTGPFRYSKPDKFNHKAWPRLSIHPIYSVSLSDFWGKRWHSLFRRIFIVVGARPFSSQLPEMLGLRGGIRKKGKMALGALGAFMTSGVLHECFNDATFWQPRDPYYRVFIFFSLQAFGMMFEKILLNSLTSGPKSQSYKIIGRIFCWSFLLCTGLLMTECWVDRGVVDNQPPIQEWTWWRWSIPLSFIVPDLSSMRLHQMKHLQ